jgi:hypothetical protein
VLTSRISQCLCRELDAACLAVLIKEVYVISMNKILSRVGLLWMSHPDRTGTATSVAVFCCVDEWFHEMPNKRERVVYLMPQCQTRLITRLFPRSQVRGAAGSYVYAPVSTHWTTVSFPRCQERSARRGILLLSRPSRPCERSRVSKFESAK